MSAGNDAAHAGRGGLQTADGVWLQPVKIYFELKEKRLMTSNDIKSVAAALTRGGRNTAFTGAGISTESGIPDYRSQGGIWDKYRPVYFDEFMSSREARVEYWRRWLESYTGMEEARPNAGHTALAQLYARGFIKAVITQNIDGLHQASGLPDAAVIELHGNTRRVRCMRCKTIVSRQAARQRLLDGDPAPECDCGGYLKPDTVSFGQSMPLDKVNQAVALAQNSDVFVVVGSTLLVQPAAHIPVLSKENQAFLAIINLSKTPCDDLADAVIRDEAGRTLAAIARAVLDTV